MRLLLVEDDDTIAEFVEKGLREAGYEAQVRDTLYNHLDGEVVRSS